MMNERIKELADQMFDMDESGDIAEVVPYGFMEKFAELIVQECLVHCEAFEIEVNRGTLVSRIKDHFGIKE
jgi:hypothetical protein